MESERQELPPGKDVFAPMSVLCFSNQGRGFKVESVWWGLGIIRLGCKIEDVCLCMCLCMCMYMCLCLCLSLSLRLGLCCAPATRDDRLRQKLAEEFRTRKTQLHLSKPAAAAAAAVVV